MTTEELLDRLKVWRSSRVSKGRLVTRKTERERQIEKLKKIMRDKGMSEEQIKATLPKVLEIAFEDSGNAVAEERGGDGSES